MGNAQNTLVFIKIHRQEGVQEQAVAAPVVWKCHDLMFHLHYILLRTAPCKIIQPLICSNS